jgi:hypothetical protein
MGPVDTQIAAETDELLRQDRTIEPPPSDPIEINGFLFHTWEMIRGDLEIE